MSLLSDIRISDFSLEFVPIETRVPLKFGTETLSSVTCSRVKVVVENRKGQKAEGWGETPLSVQWVWPSDISYSERHQALMDFSTLLIHRWRDHYQWGHCMEIGHTLIMEDLPQALEESNQSKRSNSEPMPWLAALVCSSALDLALHDAFGVVNQVSTYQSYGKEFFSRDLSTFLEPAEGFNLSFNDRYPADYLVLKRPNQIPVWHLVGGLDPLDESELTGDEPEDGYPVHLKEWITRDGLDCLKIKLRGNDSEWDYDRLVKIGAIARQYDVSSLTTDFNCTVTDPEYVNEILDRLAKEQPDSHQRILYVEQPFPYDLETHRIDVHSVSSRKPLFMDESAHDWQHIRLGRELVGMESP